MVFTKAITELKALCLLEKGGGGRYGGNHNSASLPYKMLYYKKPSWRPRLGGTDSEKNICEITFYYYILKMVILHKKRLHNQQIVQTGRRLKNMAGKMAQ